MAPAAAACRLAALLALWRLGPVEGEQVSVQGRRILVDGKPLFLKGVNWNPVPKGGSQKLGGVHFRGFVESDGEMMAAAGINAVRTYEPITDTEVLDILWRKGIYVLNTVYISGTMPPESVVKPVTALKHHPAILMWVIGNEWNYNMLYSKLSFKEAVARVRDVAALIKSLDKSHPVASVYGMVPGAEQLKLLKDVDVWGLTYYTGLSFGNLFETWSARSEKPLFVAEYGADAFNSITQRVDEAAQVHATLVLTREIIRHSILRGGPCSGGLIFELADEWWKDGSGSPGVHNKGGVAPGGGPYPDNTFNEEYWGLVSIDGTPRQAYRAYAAIQVGNENSLKHNITPGFRKKACGANPGCIGRLGDCCPTEDGRYLPCCKVPAQPHIPPPPAVHAPQRPLAVAPNAHSHQTLWLGGPAPRHCEVDHVVPCCPEGHCGSCAGNQCCPSKTGSITCPSASKAQAKGCQRPKLYDCTGLTGIVPPRNETTTRAPPSPRPGTSGPPRLRPPSLTFRPNFRPPRPPPPPPPRPPPPPFLSTSARAEARAEDTTTSGEPSPRVEFKGSATTRATTTPAWSLNLHTTMEVPKHVVTWVLGPEKTSCEDACRASGGCLEDAWPVNAEEFLQITRVLGYACYDLQEGGGKYDPSTQQGNCGWSWKGGRELLSNGEELLLTRCSASAPAFTRRFCPCRSRHGPDPPPKPVVPEPPVVMEKSPNGHWTFTHGSFPAPPRNIFA